MEATVILKDKKAIIILTDEQIAAINKQQDPYLQACLKMGETPRPTLNDRSNRRLVYEDFAHRLEMCIEAKNAIQQPDGTFKRWEAVYGKSENHYLPYFKPDSSGSGWAFLRLRFLGPEHDCQATPRISLPCANVGRG